VTNRTYLLVDGTNICHRCWWAIGKGEACEPLDVAKAVAGLIEREMWALATNLAIAIPPNCVRAAFDGGDSGRKALDPDYKATRKATHPSCAEALHLTRVYLGTARGLFACRHEGYEADDVIATWDRQVFERDGRAVILSSDRDLLQCIDPPFPPVLPPDEPYWATKMLLLKQQGAALYDGDTFLAEYGFNPVQLPLYNALVGEKGDNIAGVPGVGPTYATRLLKRYEDEGDLLAAARGGLWGRDTCPANAQKSIAASEERLRLSLRLTTLIHDVPGVRL
jgi:DNA polymerase-1